MKRIEKNNITIADKIVIIQKERLTLNDICILLEYGMPAARKFRDKCNSYSKNNNIPVFDKGVDTAVFTALTGKDTNYYINKYKQELEIKELLKLVIA